MNTNNKTILTNTISLYFRMIILTLISLYTVRVVLNVLGASDYGLYNVVGGIVSMFSFMSGTLTNASQRYFSYYLADNDWKGVSKYFSINLTIFVMIIIIVVVISETFGVWFLNTQLNIEAGRELAASIVFQLSIFTFALGLIVAPFQALLIGDENLGIYAFISVLEGAFKLVIVYFLNFMGGDKLIIYAWLQFFVRVTINCIYLVYIIRKYRELKIRLVRDKEDYKEVFSYIKWNFIGSFAAIGKSQGINIIINMFFGSVINAARGIAYQISSVISQFADNFMKAISPQITKSYALNEKERMHALIVMGSKISFFLLYIVALPLCVNINYVLILWLKEVPEYTAIFVVLVLIDLLIDGITNPIMTAVQATGDIKMYQMVVGGLYLMNLPAAYIGLVVSKEPLIPFIVGIAISVLAVLARIFLSKIKIEMSIISYVKNVILPLLILVATTLSVSYFLIPEARSFLTLVRNVFISMVLVIPAIYFIGLSPKERKILKSLFGRKR